MPENFDETMQGWIDAATEARDAALGHLVDRLYVKTADDIAVDLMETNRTYGRLFADLAADDGFPEFLAAVEGMTDAAPRSKKQALSRGAAAEYFGAGGAPQPMDVAFAVALLRDATRAKPSFDAELARVGAAVDAALGRKAALVLTAPLKSLGRGFQKVHEKYGGSYDLLTDLVRGTLQCDSLDAMRLCADEVRKSHVFDVLRVKNRFDPKDGGAGGYRDVLCNVSCGGHVAEVQFNLAAFVDVKETKGHAVYETARATHYFREHLQHYWGREGSFIERAAPRSDGDGDVPRSVCERVAAGQICCLGLFPGGSEEEDPYADEDLGMYSDDDDFSGEDPGFGDGEAY